MRTTLDIADDVLFAAKDVARRDKKTLGQVVSEIMRQALSGPAVDVTGDLAGSQPDDAIDSRFRALGFRTLPARGGIVTNELINQLREREGI
jgi:hypothetical protein